MKGFFICLYLFLVTFVTGQKLAFENYGVDRGLIQSQVQAITQDSQHHLWIGTFGGLDRFDGSSFTHYSKQQGLLSGSTTCLFTSSDGTVWISGYKGIASCHKGTITNYRFDNMPEFSVNSFAEDDKGVTWAFGFKPRLLQITGGKLKPAPLPFEKAIPTCLFKRTDGALLVCFFQKGLYAYLNNRWSKIADTDFLEADEFIVSAVSEKGDYFLISNKKIIYKYSSKGIIQSKQPDLKAIGACCIVNNELWLGSTGGIKVYDRETLSLKKSMGSSSGLSDNFINAIYKDAEDNIWIGSDGDGLFRYSDGVFKRLDNSNGLSGNIVMGLVKVKEDILIGTREGGIVRYERRTGSIKSFPPIPGHVKTGVNCMTADDKGIVYIGTIDSRLLRYNGSSFDEIKLEPVVKPFVNTVACNNDKIWIAASGGCYIIEKGIPKKIRNVPGIALSILPVDNNTALAATVDGLYEIRDTLARKINNGIPVDAEINCITRYKNYFLLGTNDNGIYLWDRQHNALYSCTTENGLGDNIVFSLYIDSKQNIWAGTGTSVHKIRFNDSNHRFKVNRFSKTDGYDYSECNLNTIIEDDSGQIWIGSTKGAFIYRGSPGALIPHKPYTVIQEVNFGNISRLKNDSNIPVLYSLPDHPLIPYKNNSISLTVKGIYLRNPQDILYSTMLEGYDEKFTIPAVESFFNYRNLEPGNYIFKVKAVTGGGIESLNIAVYAFTIQRPFYKSKWFYGLIVSVLILTGFFMQRILSLVKSKQRRKLEQVRREEQGKIRERTAEDLHDELGNRLTRISLISDVLQAKVSPEDTEKTQLISQMKENIRALYSGTKDILWSLTPAGDNFKQVLDHISVSGYEIFNDSRIEFETAGIDDIADTVLLPPDYSRNLVMLSKEIFTNVLRHSGATRIEVSVMRTGDDSYSITYADNGKGFDPQTIKKGSGVSNIQRRAERMNGRLEIQAGSTSGTLYRLILQIPRRG